LDLPVTVRQETMLFDMGPVIFLDADESHRLVGDGVRR
jgi:hypothetical protein